MPFDVDTNDQLCTELANACNVLAEANVDIVINQGRGQLIDSESKLPLRFCQTFEKSQWYLHKTVLQ